MHFHIMRSLAPIPLYDSRTLAQTVKIKLGQLPKHTFPARETLFICGARLEEDAACRSRLRKHTLIMSRSSAFLGYVKI